MNEEKKFVIHSITVEDENGVVVTLDLDTEAINPNNIDPSVAGNFWFRLGIFIAGGDTALREVLGN